jgi:hypothetical protein
VLHNVCTTQKRVFSPVEYSLTELSKSDFCTAVKSSFVIKWFISGGNKVTSACESANSHVRWCKLGTMPMPIQNSIPRIISWRTSGTTNTSKMPTLDSNVTGTFTAPMQEISDADARVQLSILVECNWKPSTRNFCHPAYPTKTRFAPESSSAVNSQPQTLTFSCELSSFLALAKRSFKAALAEFIMEGNARPN